MKMPKLILFLLLPLFSLSQQEKIDSITQAQQKQLDSFQVALKKAYSDSARYLALADIISYYQEKKRDSGLYYEEQRLSLAVKNNKKLAEAAALNTKGYFLMHLGRYSESYKCFLRSFEIAKDPKSEKTHYFLADSGFRKQRLSVLGIAQGRFGQLLARQIILNRA